MLAIHFCSDRDQTIEVLTDLLREVRRRIRLKKGIGSPDAARLFWVNIRQKKGIGSPDTARLFWVNPVADLRVMNLLEDCGAVICGTEYLFAHSLDPIPEDVEPMEALARTALSDPMAGAVWDRARRIAADSRLADSRGKSLRAGGQDNRRIYSQEA